MADVWNFLRDPQARSEMRNALTDAANRGMVAGSLGAPVDMATTLTNLLIAGGGYVGHKTGLLNQPPDLIDSRNVPGSSEWIGQKMQNAGAVSPNRNALAEFGMGLLSPVAYKGAQKMGGLLYNAESNALANAAKPSNMVMQGQRGVIMAGKPKLVTVDNGDGFGTAVPTKVIYDESAKGFNFGIGDDGHAFLRINPIWKTDKDFVKLRDFRAVDDFFWPYGEDVYIRVGNASDVAHLRAGTHRGSINHHTGEAEGGLSVSRRLETGDDLAYLVKGKRIGDGSDSEPLLDLASAKLYSEPASSKLIIKKLHNDIEKKARSLGITKEQFKAIYTNRRLMWPDAPKENNIKQQDWRSMAVRTYKSGD